MFNNQIILWTCRACGWGMGLMAVLWGFNGSAAGAGVCVVAAVGLLGVGSAHLEEAHRETPLF